MWLALAVSGLSPAWMDREIGRFVQGYRPAVQSGSWTMAMLWVGPEYAGLQDMANLAYRDGAKMVWMNYWLRREGGPYAWDGWQPVWSDLEPHERGGLLEAWSEGG